MSEQQSITSPPAGLEGWREVWEKDLRPLPSNRRWIHRVLERLLRPILDPLLHRQRNFNLASLELISDLRRDLQSIREDFNRGVESLDSDAKRVAADLAGVSQAVSGLDRKIPIASQRNDALITALDQKIESLAARLRDLTIPALADASPSSFREDFLYRRLEEGLRGSGDEVRDALAPYVELAREHPPVLDVGCGRGEFLDLCREQGIEARGLDTNERSISELKARGLHAESGAVPDALRSVSSASIGSILAAHVVEHLPVESLIGFFGECSRILQQGGLLMIETPNAQALAVSASEFWRDPTHLAPRHVAALTLLAREYGFGVERVETVHPHSSSARLELGPEHAPDLRELVRRLNELLYGDQDLRLLLRRQ